MFDSLDEMGFVFRFWDFFPFAFFFVVVDFHMTCVFGLKRRGRGVLRQCIGLEVKRLVVMEL